MATIDACLATPFTETVEINGKAKAYQFSPLNLFDLSELQDFLRSKIVASAVLAVQSTPDIDSELKDRTLRAAYAEAAKLSFIMASMSPETSATITGMLFSMDAAARVLTLSAKHNDVTFTIADAKAFMLAHPSASLVVNRIYKASGLLNEREEDSEEDTENPTSDKQ